MIECVGIISVLLRLQIDSDILYPLQLHLVSQTEHQSKLGVVRVSFRDRVNHIHNLNLTSPLILTSTNSQPKNSQHGIGQ